MPEQLARERAMLHLDIGISVLAAPFADAAERAVEAVLRRAPTAPPSCPCGTSPSGA
jgi:hypothetical protein